MHIFSILCTASIAPINLLYFTPCVILPVCEDTTRDTPVSSHFNTLTTGCENMRISSLLALFLKKEKEVYDIILLSPCLSVYPL
jgi:hypothetical protein